MTKIFISAGEASGDLHAAAITKALLKLSPQAQVFGMGGAALRAAGGEVLFDIKEHSVMGTVEVLRKLPALFRLRDAFKKVMLERRPDVFVTVDYPEFNMRIARLAKQLHIPVLSYIPPSAWAWRKGRARDVAALVNKVACIYPFEYTVYKEAGADVEFVGNPLVDIVKTHLPRAVAEAKAGKQAGKPLVLLLPGSRFKEITNVLPVMLEAVKLLHEQRPDAIFVLQKAPTIASDLLDAQLAAAGTAVKIVEGDNYDVMNVADVALATSGTVTLEAALCGLPAVICYKASALTVALGRLLIKTKYIGLPNILAGREILPELIQQDMTAEKMAAAALHFLEPQAYKDIRQELQAVVAKLGAPGAVERVATLILKLAGEAK